MGLNQIWLNKSCPKCNESNFILLKTYDEWEWDISIDLSDIEDMPVEAIQCHTCNHIFLIVDTSEWAFDKTKDILPEDWEEFDYKKIREKIEVLIKNDSQLQNFINQLATKQKGKKMVEA